MDSRLIELFTDPDFIAFTQARLPHLFQIAELESMRSRQLGMEVGIPRERILIALFIRCFGRDNISIGPTTESERDVRVFGSPISIKTITIDCNTFAGVKAVWTVEEGSARRFAERYVPECDLLLARIWWDHTGDLYLIPREVQREKLQAVGWEAFLKLPKKDTNPRGIEFKTDALAAMAHHPNSLSFPIYWRKTKLEYDIYKRWLEAWNEVVDEYTTSYQGNLL